MPKHVIRTQGLPPDRASSRPAKMPREFSFSPPKKRASVTPAPSRDREGMKVN